MSETEYIAPERALASVHPSVAAWSIDRVYGDPPAAAEAVSALLERPEITNDPSSVAGAHFVLGTAYAVLGELTLAEEHLDTAERLFSEGGNELAVAHVTVRRDLIWHQREQFHDALERFPAALEIARKYQDAWLETAILSDLGLINLRIGDVPAGIDSLFAALAVAERTSDRLQETVIRMNLASAFVELHDFEVASEWLRQCLAVSKEFQSVGVAFECTQMLAVCEEQLGRPLQALELLDGAIRLAESLEFPFGLGESSYDQGRLLLRLGRTGEAAAAFNRSIAHFRKVETPAARARIAMCEWWLESLARQFTTETYHALTAVSDEGVITPYLRAFDLHDALSQSAEALGMDREAVAHLRKSRAFAEEYWAKIADRQARVALKRYQLATAERTAQQERRHREELAEALAAAEKLNAENQVLLEKLRAQSIILEQQATEDALTGIGNRRYFDAQLEQELNRARQFDRPISVALADIDNFKEINDRYSHRTGDEVLIAVAAILRGLLQGPDVYARYGGEEFAFIFPESDSARVDVLAETVRSAIARHDWESIAIGLTVTISMGLITRTGAVSRTQIVSAADSLLYRAKRTGKNQVEHAVVNDEAIDDHPLFAGDRSDSWIVIQ